MTSSKSSRKFLIVLGFSLIALIGLTAENSYAKVRPTKSNVGTVYLCDSAGDSGCPNGGRCLTTSTGVLACHTMNGGSQVITANRAISPIDGAAAGKNPPPK